MRRASKHRVTEFSGLLLADRSHSKFDSVGADSRG